MRVSHVLFVPVITAQFVPVITLPFFCLYSYILYMYWLSSAFELVLTTLFHFGMNLSLVLLIEPSVLLFLLWTAPFLLHGLCLTKKPTKSKPQTDIYLTDNLITRTFLSGLLLIIQMVQQKLAVKLLSNICLLFRKNCSLCVCVWRVYFKHSFFKMPE